MSTSLVIDVLDDEVVVERRGADGVVSGRAVVPVASTGYRVDPEVWWTALVDAVDAVVGPGALDASGIGEVVLCACPKGVVVTDGHGAPVGPALVGDDPDTAPDAKWLTKQVDGGADGWIAAVGAAPTAQWTASKLSWLHRSDADVWGRVALVMQPQDWLVQRMTGSAATDRRTARHTGYWSADHGYRFDLLAIIDRDLDWGPKLPVVVDDGAVVGAWRGVPVRLWSE